MSKTKVYAWLLAVVMLLPLRAQERYTFTNLSLANGLSQITVICIYQDSKGYMWFGTRNGLNRYDGYRFETFLNDPDVSTSISDNHILCMQEDNRGNLWVGTTNGLNCLNLSTNSLASYYANPEKPGSLSHNTIHSLCLDPEGNLWVGTGKGLDLYDSTTDTFAPVDAGGVLDGNFINKIVSHEGKLYLATSATGLVIYNPHTRQQEVYRHNPADPSSLAHNHVRTLWIDKESTVWAGTHHSGLSLMKKGEKHFTTLTRSHGLTNDYIRCINYAPDGNILVGTYNGLNVIHPQTGKISQYQYNAGDGGLNHFSIYCIYVDKAQTLWIGSWAGGVDYYSSYSQRFGYHTIPQVQGNMINSIVGPMLETGNSVYFATEGSGLLEWNKQTGASYAYRMFDNFSETYNQNTFKSLYYDDGRILCGTNAGTVYAFDPRQHKFQLLHSLYVEHPVYYIGRNHRGDLMVGSVNDPEGLAFIDRDGRRTERFPVSGRKPQAFPNVRCLLEVTKDRYLIGTRNEGLYDYNAATEELVQYKNELDSYHPQQIPGNYITSIFKDSKGRIWVGTFGAGMALFDYENGLFTPYNTKKGLFNNNICTIVEGVSGHLWVSTISGISDFNPGDNSFVNYSHSNGIRIHEFTPHAGLALSDGRIVFSGNNGFTTFNPAQMHDNPHVPPVVLRNLYIGNHPVIPGDDSGILSRQVNEQGEIVLKYNQSNLSIEYSALNYLFPEQNQYAYKLEGFDKQWNEVGSRRMAYYTNIPPGTYRFVVRGSNNNGVWNNEGTSLSITVLPPYWKTWWAYTLYILTVGAILWLVYRYFSVRKRLENDIKLKQAEAKVQAEFHEARNNLFTNFSHELRTPLTLIMGPLGDMIERKETSPEKEMSTLRLMQSNGYRLLRLVNNLMDFQKRESGKLILKASQSDLVAFSRDMTQAFAELAASRAIDLQFVSTCPELLHWFDRNLLEKVYFNFLSNAFKNVPDGGVVSVTLSTFTREELDRRFPAQTSWDTGVALQFVSIEICDTGIGIPEDELEKIFIPFYQVAQNEHSASGTGLGLSLSKSIIEMHRGKVWAEIPSNGGGALFRILLPVGKELFSPEEIVTEYVETPAYRPVVEVALDNEWSESGTVLRKGVRYTVLVVEDNVEVRRYIVSHLSSSYKVFEAGNGADGLDKAQVELPDLIITDLMMPKMDGMEMTQRLKKDIRTSHIPIIILTARTQNQDKKAGYEVGADDYIIKPFDASVLKVRVENLILNRERLKDTYGKRFTLDTLGVDTSSADELFMNKLYTILEEHVSNPELDIDHVAKEIGMSRSNLYRKMKSLTNVPPNEFIRNFRLEMGAKILREARVPITEIYVAVGFSSHAYFTRCFKVFHGVPPTEYAARQHAFPAEEKKEG